MAKGAKQRKVQVDVDQVTFGVEIECTLPDAAIRQMGIEIGSYHRGKLLPAPFPEGWNAQHDGSLDWGYGYRALEIVSPVLRGIEGLAEVLRVFEILNEAGVVVNGSCGFHVHVGARSVLGARFSDSALVVRWVRRMLHLMSVHEMALFALTGDAARANNYFCQTIKDQWDGVLETTSPVATIVEKTDDHDDRYHTLNLCNLFDAKGTVEFRLFAATTDGMQALGYIVMALGIAHRAATVGTVMSFDGQVRTAVQVDCRGALADLQKALARFGWPTGAKERWGRAIRQVQAECARRFGEQA